MAIVRNNLLLEGVSRMFGSKMVFKLLRGKTIVAKAPQKPSRQSEAQRTNRLKFKDATRFAKLAMHDPVKKEYYWRKAKEMNLPNAYTAAITDFMRKPDVAEVFVKEASQTRQVTLHAFKKDFVLRRVVVQCLDIHRQVVDLYEATPDDRDLWKFDMPANASVKTLKVELIDDTGQTRYTEKPSP